MVDGFSCNPEGYSCDIILLCLFNRVYDASFAENDTKIRRIRSFQDCGSPFWRGTPDDGKIGLKSENIARMGTKVMIDN
jgi:hypothetical protein